MFNVWNDDDNLIMLHDGFLLLFWLWMVLVRCNIHYVAFGNRL